MSIFIKQSYDDGFQHLLLDLKDKYPKSIFQLEGIDESQLDITQYTQNYFIKGKPVADSTIDSNANVQSKDISNYKAEMHKAEDKLNSLFLLWKTAKKNWGTKYANKLIEEEIIKDINIQDATNVFLSYCFAFDCIDLVDNGLPFIANKPSKPTKHADTLLRHAEQLVMSATRQMMGATAIPNILVIYSALLKRDLDDKKYHISAYKDSPFFKQYIKQEFQKFVFTINQPIRSDQQSPFTNITIFDSIFLKELCNLYLINGKHIDPDFAMEIQKEFIECFLEFNRDELFTFPVITIQFKIDENNEIEDKEFFDYICEKNLEFANFNIFSAKNLTALSSCCRLLSSIEDIIQATKDENLNLIGGSSIKVGSFGVTSINLPRIALRTKGDKEQFMEILQELAIDCYRVNLCRKERIEKMIEEDQLSLYTHGFMDLKNQYNTIGIIGLYEAIDFMGMNILSVEGKHFAIEILQKLQDIVNKKIEKYSHRSNIEFIPGESTCIRFAKTDKILYKQDKYALYSNQFFPLTGETDLLNRIELQAMFEQYFSGGAILHLNTSEKIESKKVMKNLMEYTIKKGVQYFAVNYFFAICEENHLTVSTNNTCSICGKKIVERACRIVGFLTKISSWQEERRNEFFDRKTYKNGSLINLEKEEKN